jgi:hypothetical protein
MKCFKCSEYGHSADICPLLVPAQSFDEHIARIDRYVERWISGELTREAKRRSISAENILWYGEKCPRHLIYP